MKVPFCTMLGNLQCRANQGVASGYGLWRWCFGGAVSPLYVHSGTLRNTLVVVFLSAVYAGESNTNPTRECFLILFAGI